MNNFKNIKKIKIMPQVIVYKKIFEKSEDVLNLINKKNNNTVLLSEWKQWYEQGLRRGCWIDEDILLNMNNLDEKNILLEFYNILKYIRKDYFNEFTKDNAIWPSFIKQWNMLKKDPEGYFIDFFKYNIPEDTFENNNKIMMKYHVDELPILKEIKKSRNVVTINVYLNNDYNGGEICVYDSNLNKSYMYKPKAGDAVVMPSFSPFYHAVKTFNGANRYFMRAFFKYECEGDDLQYDKIEEVEDEYVKKNLQLIEISVLETEIFGD